MVLTEKQITNREEEIMLEVTKGYTFKEIANRLFISTHTVETHVKNIKKKTGARSNVDIARIFILSLDEPKQFFRTIAATFFLGLQIFICTDNYNIDMRRANNSFKPRTFKIYRELLTE